LCERKKQITSFEEKLSFLKSGTALLLRGFKDNHERRQERGEAMSQLDFHT